MNATPSVSVVMGVHNGAATLRDTLDSIFAQRDLDFEVVVVDDGSTDDTAQILHAYGSKLLVLHQDNQGLTRALIAGCRAARAPLIARHDCGDRSHPDRLTRQKRLLDANDAIVLASCATRYFGPENETLYVVRADGTEIRESLMNHAVETIRGLPHHGTAMFRRDAYFEAGEYREEFRVAQDLDLWIRFAQRGEIAVDPDVLYEARFEPGAISHTRRTQQLAAAAVAVALRDAPIADRPALLRRAAALSASKPLHRASEADAFYFLASTLRASRHPRWRHYAWQTVRRNPFHLRAWLRLLTSS